VGSGFWKAMLLMSDAANPSHLAGQTDFTTLVYKVQQSVSCKMPVLNHEGSDILFRILTVKHIGFVTGCRGKAQKTAPLVSASNKWTHAHTNVRSSPLGRLQNNQRPRLSLTPHALL
jgi:hypothetical protein